MAPHRRHFASRIGRLFLPLSFLAVPVFGFSQSDRALAQASESPSPDRSSPAPEDRSQPRAKALDALFSRLKTIEDADAASLIEQAIWAVWMQTGRHDVDGLMQRAVAAMAIREFQAALGLLDQLVRLAPNHSEGWNKRATVLYLMGDFARSLSDIERVLKLEPRHFGAISGIALIKIAQGDKKAALAAYRRALEIHPFLPGARQMLPALERDVEGSPT